MAVTPNKFRTRKFYCSIYKILISFKLTMKLVVVKCSTWTNMPSYCSCCSIFINIISCTIFIKPKSVIRDLFHSIF